MSEFLAIVQATADAGTADRAALERMARGDQDALGELYDRHGRLVYSLALRIVRDQRDAEEIVQEVFSQAWRQSGRYRPGRGSVLAWVLTLTRSRAIDRVRGRRSRPDAAAHDTALVDLPDSAPAADEQLAWAGRAAQV